MRCTWMITIIKGTDKNPNLCAVAPAPAAAAEMICQHVNIHLYYIEMYGD